MIARVIAGAALALLMASPALAHPHAWIDTSEEVVFDAQGRVVAIRERWLFDEFYTAATVKFSGKGNNVAALIDKIMHNLSEWNYFTRVYLDGHEVKLGNPLTQAGEMDGHRLVMTFEVPLEKPVAPDKAVLTYAVYDPTYYIEMLHAEISHPVTLSGGAPTGCTARVVQPNPDPKAVARAAALDQTQSGGNGLGVNFAETVEIRCAASN